MTASNNDFRYVAKAGFNQYNQSVAQLYAPHDGFRVAMHNAGLVSDTAIVADGEIHRFKPEGDKRPNAWYVFYGDGGAFGNWRTGLRETWFRGDLKDHRRREIRSEVLDVQKAEREKRELGHRKMAQVAARRWKAATNATEHPYLKAKCVQSHGLKTEDGNLLIPLCHEQHLWSLQIIYKDGRKRFLSGGRTGGCYFPIGTPGGRIWLAEGYATAATIHEITGDLVVCAFNASNLVKVAAHIREQFNDREIYVAADNDDAGIKAATDAMQKHNLEGWVASDESNMDWNDHRRKYGKEKTLQGLCK